MHGTVEAHLAQISNCLTRLYFMTRFDANMMCNTINMQLGDGHWVFTTLY